MADNGSDVGSVVALRRYPVKSMLGEDQAAATVTEAGLRGDRVTAVLDVQTGMVASAKHPKLWRRLLEFRAQWHDGYTQIWFPDGRRMSLGDQSRDLDVREANEAMSQVLGRQVQLTTNRPQHATVGRPAPEAVIDAGVDADVPFDNIEIGQGTPGTTFVDFAPIHVVTTATLDRADAELVRYRPNLVVDLPGSAAFAENDWTDHELTVGAVRLRILRPTRRCAVPTLAHGALPRRTDAVRTLMQHNRVPTADMQPCLGAYAEVITPGHIQAGDAAVLHPAPGYSPARHRRRPASQGAS